MSSMMSSHGVAAALATAMAVSGTVILLAFRLQKSHQLPLHHHQILRSCITSSDGKSKKQRKTTAATKKTKRVHFAEDVDVVDFPARDSGHSRSEMSDENGGISESKGEERRRRRRRKREGKMPENREALYKGILRDRVAQRLAYSY